VVTGPLTSLADLIKQRTGIIIPEARTQALWAALGRAAPGLDETAFLTAAADPVRGPPLLDRLIDEVTVQETCFARDPDQLGIIHWRGLAQDSGAPAGRGQGGATPTRSERAGGQRQAAPVRVWSAGCATGEEAYTLALLASESFTPAAPPVDVLGTDISGAALASAVAGRYGTRAVRGLSTLLRYRYLVHQSDGTYLVNDRLRELVRFRRHNLASDPVPPLGEAPFDLIVCRNVLIYFGGPLILRVTGQLEHALAPGGVLVLGAADAVARTAALGTQAQQGARSRQGRPPDRPHTGRPRAGRAGAAHQAGAGGRAGAGGQGTGTRQDIAPPGRQERLAAALEAAGRGDRDDALAQVASLLATDPLDADAHFVEGLVTLEAGEPARAADALRRALYTDPTYALAAFTLGRACDALGDRAAARRAYGQALRSIDPGDERHEPMLQQVGLGDIAAACRARLRGPE
jgi:chemotaxis protein methyltransferase CheR